MEIIEKFIVSMIQVISWTYINKKIVSQQVKLNHLNKILTLLIMSLCIFSLLIFDITFLKPIILYFIMILGYKYIFEISFSESLIINFFNVIIHGICEALITLSLILILPKEIMNNILISPLTGGLAFFLIIIIIKTLKKKILKIVNMLKKGKIMYFLCVFLVFSISILIFLKINSKMNSWNNQTELTINILTIILFIIVIILLFQEKFNTIKSNIEFNNMYNRLQEVLGILETYKKINHENKTDLMIIKNKSSNNREVIEYIDNILEDKNISQDKRWITELNKINNSEISGFLLMKLNKIDKNKVNFDLHINKKVSKYNFSRLRKKEYRNFCRLLSIYIDNAYEACLETNEKEISIEINVKYEVLEIIISNNYKGVINLNKIDKPNFTTKGLSHGVGRALAKEIIDTSDNFSETTKIIQNYFFQYLYVKI